MHDNAITTRNRQEGGGWGVQEERVDTEETGGEESGDKNTGEACVVVHMLTWAATGWSKQRTEGKEDTLLT